MAGLSINLSALNKLQKDIRMTQDNTINPYDAPSADLHIQTQQGEIQFSDMNKLSSGDGFGIIGDAWTIYKMAPVKWTFVTLLLLVIMMLMNVIPVLGVLLSMVMTTPLMAGIYIAAEDVSQGKALTFGHIFAAFQGKAGKLMAFGVVYSILYLLAIGIVLGLAGASELMPLFLGADPDPALFEQNAGLLAGMMIAVVTVGLVAAMAYWFAVPLITFQNKGMFEAMGMSIKASLKNIWPMTLFGLALLVWMFIAAIPLLLGYLILLPVLYISIYTGYRKIFTE